MNWDTKVSKDTCQDALGTLNMLYSVSNPVISEVKDFTLSQLLRRNIDNMGRHRIKNLQKAKKKGIKDIKTLALIAYPKNDRNIGRTTDISSVIYHTTTLNKVSPIVIGRYRKGRYIYYIKLDGVHRLVGSVIRGGLIRVAIMNFDMNIKYSVPKYKRFGTSEKMSNEDLAIIKQQLISCNNCKPKTKKSKTKKSKTKNSKINKSKTKNSKINKSKTRKSKIKK